MDAINIGVIGYGYWGSKMVRNFLQMSDITVVAICDLQPSQLRTKVQYPNIEVTRNSQDLFKNPKIDAIAIATPVSSHFYLTLKALQTGKHVLISKPLTATSEQAQRLIEEADRRQLILMVDHTFIYSSAVRKIQELINNKELADIYYYDSVRVNLGLFQYDVNVIWDLAVHDLAIMDFVLSSQPIAVSAVGMSHIQGMPENIGYLTLFFDSNLIAHIHVNWLAPVKTRQTIIGGELKMIVYDDLETSGKVKVYDKGITLVKNTKNIYQPLVDYRTGNIWIPQLEIIEPLYREISHFIDCIKLNKCPLTDGRNGLRVIRILEAATKSMKEQGKLIEL